MLLYSVSSTSVVNRRTWVVNATSRPPYARERPGTRCIGGCVSPRAVLDGCVLCGLIPLISGTQARLHHNFVAALLSDICLVSCLPAQRACICCDQKHNKRYTLYLCFWVLWILTGVAVTSCSPVGAAVLPLCSGYLSILSVCVALCNWTLTFTVFAIDW